MQPGLVPYWDLIAKPKIALRVCARTHMLVSLAAAAFTAITFAIHHSTPGSGSDPIRIVEAVTAGVAFLAAGAIIQSGRRVIGVTTGASLWLTGAVGVAAGTGQFGIAVMSTIFALVILTAIGWLERRYLEPVLKSENDGSQDASMRGTERGNERDR